MTALERSIENRPQAAILGAISSNGAATTAAEGGWLGRRLTPGLRRRSGRSALFSGHGRRGAVQVDRNV